MSTVRFSKLTTSPAQTGKKYRTWDLRRVEQYSNFGTTYLDYQVLVDEPVNLTTHFDTPQQNVDMTKRCLTTILKDIITDVVSRGFDDTNVTHIFMHLHGMDQDFAFIDSGDNARSLQDFHIDTKTIKAVVDKFSAIVQSGKPVILDGRTTIRVAVFEPPKEKVQSLLPRFIGSGWGCGSAFESFSIDEFASRCRGVVVIQNEDKLCMARALVVCMAAHDKDKDKTSKKFFENIRDPKRNSQYRQAVMLCVKAGVDDRKPADEADMEKFAKVLNVNIEVFEHRHTFMDHVYHTHYIPNRPDIFLLYNAEKKHFDAITNINAVLRAVKNHARTFCKDCRKVVTLANDGYHNCYKEGEKKLFVINDEVLYYEPD